MIVIGEIWLKGEACHMSPNMTHVVTQIIFKDHPPNVRYETSSNVTADPNMFHYIKELHIS
jgi:hypothetical protein